MVVVNLGEILPGDFEILDVLFALGGALYRTAEAIAPGTLARRLYTDLLVSMTAEAQPLDPARACPRVAGQA